MAIDVVVKVYATRANGEVVKVGERRVLEIQPGWSGDWIDLSWPGGKEVLTFSKSELEAAMQRCVGL